MKASEYLAVLQRLIQEHGDLPMQKWTGALGRHDAQGPVVAFERVEDPKGGRPPMSGFWHPTDPAWRKGDKVFRV